MARNPEKLRSPWWTWGLFLLVGAALCTYGEWRSGLSDGPPDAPVLTASGDAELPHPESVDHPATGEKIRFLAVNACNYSVREAPDMKVKAVEARNALAAEIASVNPDVVGLCEIDGPEALADLRARLKACGLVYPVAIGPLASGGHRCLAMLSRVPLHKDRSLLEVDLPGGGRMLRGILDVTLEAGEGTIRFLGVHLKSHVTVGGVSDAEQAALRCGEALAVRKYLDGILSDDPTVRCLVYGDFNDGPGDEAYDIVRKTAGKPMSPLRLKDSRGEFWTIYHAPTRTYKAFDHILLTPALRASMRSGCPGGVIDDPAFKAASDHRALWTDLK